MKSSAKDQAEGTLHEVKGKLKEMAGKISGNPKLMVSSKVTDSKKTIFSGVIKPFTNMKKSIVGQIRRSFFSHDQKSADHATFDETIKVGSFR